LATDRRVKKLTNNIDTQYYYLLSKRQGIEHTTLSFLPEPFWLKDATPLILLPAMAKRAMKKRVRQPNLLAAEKVTIRRLYHEQNYGCPEIAKMYSHAPSCMYKVLFNHRHSMKKVGRPQALTEADVDRIIEVKNKMAPRPTHTHTNSAPSTRTLHERSGWERRGSILFCCPQEIRLRLL